MHPNPKFSVGDKVRMSRATLYDERDGEITSVEKVFKTTMSGGLSTLESSISSIKLKYEFDGDTLIVYYPEHDFGTWIQKAYMQISKFYGYSYTVKSERMNTQYPEKMLKKI